MNTPDSIPVTVPPPCGSHGGPDPGREVYGAWSCRCGALWPPQDARCVTCGQDNPGSDGSMTRTFTTASAMLAAGSGDWPTFVRALPPGSEGGLAFTLACMAVDCGRAMMFLSAKEDQREAGIRYMEASLGPVLGFGDAADRVRIEGGRVVVPDGFPADPGDAPDLPDDEETNADLILNGDVCEVCGEEFWDDHEAGDGGDGFPRRCDACEDEDGPAAILADFLALTNPGGWEETAAGFPREARAEATRELRSRAIRAAAGAVFLNAYDDPDKRPEDVRSEAAGASAQVARWSLSEDAYAQAIQDRHWASPDETWTPEGA